MHVAAPTRIEFTPKAVRDCALLAAVYALAGLASLHYGSDATSPYGTIRAESGLALAALLLFGFRLLPGVALGAIVVSAYGFPHPLAALGSAAANTAAPALAALLLTRIAHFRPRLARLADASALMVYGVLLSPMLAALAGAAGLAVAGPPGDDQGMAAFLALWLGHAGGVVLFTPLLLAMPAYAASGFELRRTVEAVALIALQAAIAFGIISGHLQSLLGSTRINFLLLPLAMVLALRHRLLFTAAANLTVFSIGIWATRNGLGPFAATTGGRGLLQIEFALTAFSTIALAVNAVSEERRSASAAAAANLDRFRELSELSSDWYWEQDAALRFTFLSAAVQEKTGISADVRLGKLRWELPGTRFDAAALERHKAQLAAREPFRDFVYRRVKPDGNEMWVSTSGKPIYDDHGRFAGYRGIGRDITQQHVADRALVEERRFFEGVLNAIASPIVVKDEQHRFVGFNDAALAFLGRSREALIGRTDFDLFSEERARFLQHTDDLALSSDAPVEYESNYDVYGTRRTMFVRKSALPRPDGSRVLVLIMTDITERKAAEDALRASERRFRDIAEVAGEYVWENDLKGRFTYVSPQASEVLGYAPAELLGHSAAEYMPPGEAERVRAWLKEHMGADGLFKGLEHQFIARSGEILWLQINGVATWDLQGNRTGHRGTTRDITQIKRSEARISYLATRDPLTELPNRLLFIDRLEQGVNSARRGDQSLGVLFIDLDRFKNINDSLGHHVGDLLLKEVAQRMSACIRRGDTLARLGGDEFIIAAEQLRRAEDATTIADKIVYALTRPIEVGGHTLNTSCSIGISIFPNDGDDGATLMKNADTAMYHAKEKGRNNFQFFSPDMNVRAVERHRLEGALRQALERAEFRLLYQPQVEIETGRVIGAEALIRWQHPERGLIAPASFVGVAEECGLIEPIGRWVLQEACAQMQRWNESAPEPLRVGVNISARQLLDPKEFLRFVQQVLDETGLDPRLLELEMTESLLLKNVEENVAMFRRLGKLGVRIAVDDFGTGYSSLAYLKQLPIDTLKVDRTFVRDLETDPEDAVIVSAIIAMAHSLNLRVTAEGVETSGQLAALRKLGCDYYQGYLLSRPAAAAEFATRFTAASTLGSAR